ncbi:MAG: hypothetical protein WC529_01390 [Candidatus Margulisiibacteriota bacterium]
MLNISAKTITIITHVQRRYIGGFLPVAKNCQRLADSPLAGRVFEHRSSTLPPLLQHSGQVNLQTGMDYNLGAIEAENVIMAGGSMLLPASYYPGFPENQIGRCQFNAFNALLDDLRLNERPRENPVNIHFAADTLYYSGVKIEEYDGEQETTELKELPPARPDVLGRYEEILAARGLDSQVQLHFWRSVDELLAHLAKEAAA